MSGKTVYLAGPISGLSYAAADDWREVVRAVFDDVGIKTLSPLRAKEYLKALGKTALDSAVDYGDFSCLSSNRGITTRDRWDATRCDVLLVNLLGADRVSTGTVMEIAWADLRRTPIVCAIEEKGNPHEHCMLMDCVGFRVTTLTEAVDVVEALLL